MKITTPVGALMNYIFAILEMLYINCKYFCSSVWRPGSGPTSQHIQELEARVSQLQHQLERVWLSI